MSLTSGWANRCLISHEVPAHKQTPWRCKVARYVPCGDHETYRFVQFYAGMRGVFVRLECGTYNPGVGNLALGGLSVPVDRDLVPPICNMLIPSLGVGQPSAQMFLGQDQTVIVAVTLGHAPQACTPRFQARRRWGPSPRTFPHRGNG